MEEIRTRAWCEKEKKFYYFNGVFNDCPAVETSTFPQYESILCFAELSDQELFTGLKDKNGREIYEGDIVQWDDMSDGQYWRICEVKWVPAHYRLVGFTSATGDPLARIPVNFSFGAFSYEQDGMLEIIGNIHENPELCLRL